MKKLFLLLSIGLFSCNDVTTTYMYVDDSDSISEKITEPSLIVLGTIQDAGSPHIGCKKDCCASLFEWPNPDRKVVSLGLIDPASKSQYLFEATPDIASQLKLLQKQTKIENELPTGIFLTHAHIGHYSGLMYLGKEAVNANNIPVYTMPKMKIFLEGNGPWSQLVDNRNIVLKPIKNLEKLILSDQLQVSSILVPHRDEFSETVGYSIKGPNKSVLFIPDIDKWEKWNWDILKMIAVHDYVFLDATFFDSEEINNRDISEIPHPFIIESMAKFKLLPASEKKKIYFIHFNHTNPVIDSESEAYQMVVDNGFNIAQINDVIKL